MRLPGGLWRDLGPLFHAKHVLTIEAIKVYDLGTPGGAMGKSWPRSGSIVTRWLRAVKAARAWFIKEVNHDRQEGEN